MLKIATPTDLETELNALLQANRQGATREDLSARLHGIAHRMAADSEAQADAVKEASKLAKAALPDLKKLNDVLNKAFPYGKHAAGSREDHFRNVAAMLYTSCKSLIRDLAN